MDEVDVHPVDLGRELRQARSASPRPCASRTRSPSRWRAPESSPAARPATDLRRALWRASASPRCGGAGLPAPLPECRTGTDGSRLRSRQLPCPPPVVGSTHQSLRAVALRRRAANFVEGRRTTATRRTIQGRHSQSPDRRVNVVHHIRTSPLGGASPNDLFPRTQDGVRHRGGRTDNRGDRTAEGVRFRM